MAEEKNIIDDVERVEISPSGGENVDQPEGEEPEGDEATTPKEQEPHKEKLIENKPEAPTEDNKEPAPVDGETPRERALRLELEKLRAERRDSRAAELHKDLPPPAPKKELSPQQQEILKKYKPEEIASLKEVFPILATDMGFVRAEELTAQQYQEKSENILQEFLDKHPEYMPENDKDNILWNRFKEEYNLYAKPQNPNDLKKIFNRVHTTIFGIQPAGDKGAIIAAQKKINVASHAGASGPNPSTKEPRTRHSTSGLRLDMLKGFTDEEKAELAGE